ncbi:uncharacterized protein [Chelonus insularis]|uniref:uncharacterized protein n=1 Tax=Chelonus insularis TaxID=460826 RepID=UPI00158A0C53|nr:uncharacterized protein LOC118074637 [Chelonus insularis]
MRDMQLSSSTYCDWSSFIREVLEYWALKNSAAKIGGRNKVVEIDKAKFGRRKYHKGRIIDGQWLFGGFERESKTFFIEAVPNRTKETLLAIIKRKIRPNTTIMSDCWKAYDCLSDEGFKHLRVNHKHNFVDPDTGAYTQNIERTWRTARAHIPNYGRREKNMSGYIAELFFRSKIIDHRDRLHEFFITLREFHDELISE